MKKLYSFISSAILPATIFSCLFLLSVFMSCEKNPAEVFGETSIQGKWKLTEMLADPGNGSGTWNKVNTYKFLIFNEDGSIESNAPSPKFIKYELTDSIRIKFTREDSTIYSYYYELNGASLILHAPCIEACGEKYVKENNLSSDLN